MRSRGFVVAAAVVVVVAVVVGLLGWHLQPWREKAELGQLIELDNEVGDGAFDFEPAREIELRVPTGALVIQVGEPTDTLPHGSRTVDVGTLDDGDLHASRGADFLPLTWRFETRALPAHVLDGQTSAPPDLMALALRAGGDTTVIDDALFDDVGFGGRDDHAGVALVVEEDDVASASVVLDFDGEEQVARLDDGEVDAGLAAPLYDLTDRPSSEYVTAPPVGRLPEGFGVDGELGVGEVVYRPWLPALGWVEKPGTAWLAVEVFSMIDPTPSPQPPSEFGYGLRLDDHEETVGGDGAVVADLRAQDGTGAGNIAVNGSAVWLVEEPPADLVLRHELSVVDRSGSRVVARFDLTATLDVRRAAIGMDQ